MKKWLPARLLGTAVLAGTLALRAVRALGELESVRRFYFDGQGLIWMLIGLALFCGPYLTAAAAIAALWLRRDWAGPLGAVAFCAAGFFTLDEGLTLFARAMNGNSGYVGAEPLFSALACGISIIAVLRAWGPREQ